MKSRASDGVGARLRLRIPYGRQARSFEIPKHRLGELLSPRDVAPDDRPVAQAVSEGLDRPIGVPKLEEMVASDRKVAIMVDDNTRPTPVRQILPVVLDRLESGGVQRERIVVVIALGTHRPLSDAEIREKIGWETLLRVKVENHDFRDLRTLVHVGESSDGIPIWVNRTVQEADFRIGIGNIVPHCVAGWSGGGKIVYPGVAGEKTVDGFHGAFGTDLENRLGNDEAPIRADIERLVGYVGLEFIVNTVLTPRGELYRVVAGHHKAAHRAGVEYAREVYAVPTVRPADVAVVSSYPADVDFWQAGKAVYAGELIVRDGGTLIVATPCPEGIAQNHDLLGYSKQSVESLVQDMRRFAVEDRAAAAAAIRIGMVTRRIRVVLVSDGIGRTQAEQLGFSHAEDLQSAVNEALATCGERGRVSVMTHGGETYPQSVSPPVVENGGGDS